MKYFLLIIQFFFVSITFSQQNIEFEKLTSEKGVTQSITYAIQQDKTGTIWIATEEGVIKYNSSFSVIYNKYNGLPDEIGNRINTLFIDSKDGIWIGTDSGVCKYNPKLDTFDYLEHNENLKPNLIKSIIEDRQGRLWFGSYNGLWMFDATTSKFTNKTNKTHKKIINVQCLYYGLNEKILIGTPKGLYVYDIKKKQVKWKKIKGNSNSVLSISRNKSDYLIGTRDHGFFKIGKKFSKLEKINFSKNKSKKLTIRGILKDKFGFIYLATDGAGIYYLDNNYQEIHHYKHSEDNPNSLSSDGVYDILIDKENILWIATYGGGINYLDKSKSVFQKIKHEQNNSNSIKNSFTRAIEVDANGNFWFGTKTGVSIWNPKNNKWSHLKEIRDIVLSLQKDGNFVWVGTFNNGVYKVNIQNFKTQNLDLKIKKIYTLYKDSENNIWVGGIEENLTKLTVDNTIHTYPLKDLKSISETATGNILVAGRYGLHEIAKNDSITKLKGLDQNNKKLQYFTINTVIHSLKNHLILATNGSGIIFYNVAKKSFKSLNMKSGLPSDIVQGLISVNQNELWASTTNGLAQIKLSKLDTIIHVFDKSDGLASTEHNYGSYKKINKNSFAFGGVNGVTLFNPKKVKNLNVKPTILFEEFSIFNKVIKPGDKRLGAHINTLDTIQLKHSENSISFKFIGVLHNSPGKIKYSWKLDGLSENWSAPSKNNQVDFTNLKYGNYDFKIKASNSYGEWGAERTMAIKIMAPWWATKTAFGGYFILIIFIFISTIYLTRIMVNKKNAEEQVEFFNNLTHEIRTPLTILLSSLDSVQKNKDADSNKQAKKTIKRLNSLFEQMLNFKKVTSSNNNIQNISKINLEEHIQGLINNFLPLSAEHNIEIHLNNQWLKEVFYFDKEILNKIVFNLISNGIKYTPDNGEITINISETEKNELLFKIKDTGIGIPKDQQKHILQRYYRARNVINSQKPGTGLGLMMVKRLVEKTNGNISFVSSENIGTTFNVILKNQESNYTNTAVLDESFQQEFVINENQDIAEYSDSKILIIEDNNELRTLLSRSLGTYFQIHEASNGQEGLETAGQIFPDIILTDLIMPELDGLEMAKKLKDDINLNHIPVFMMTVLNNSELKIESIESGISEYIEKPIDINLLLAKITNTLKWQNKLRKKYIHQSEKDTAIKYRNTKDEEFVTNLEQILISKINDSSFSVHDLCDHIGMSRTSLYMKLKNLIDLSPQDFIIHSRLKYAKTLLIKGNLTIKEVAYQSGFSNPKYFSTSFKKFYNTTPTGFLESLDKES